MSTAKDKLKNKMQSGANGPDKFAAAEAAMAAGGLARPDLELTPYVAPVEPVAAVKPRAAKVAKLDVKADVKQPAGYGVAVRESISLLPAESQVIDQVRMRMASLGNIPNRSEVLRAGILSLATLSDEQLEQLLGQVPRLRPGRPV
jgi:hypothetical protein